jgi:hypothetical protein
MRTEHGEEGTVHVLNSSKVFVCLGSTGWEDVVTSQGHPWDSFFFFFLLLPHLSLKTALTFFFFFFFFAVLGFELRAYTLSHSASPFCDGFFQDRISQTICPGWL